MADNPYSVNVVNPLQALLIGQQAYSTGQENNKKQAVEQARAEAGQLYQQGDIKGALSKLLTGGDLQGAGTYSTLDNNAWTRQHTTERDSASDRHQKVMEGIALRGANRADEGPVEKAAERMKLLRQQGIDPASPEGRAFVISGEWTGPGAGGASLNPVYGVGPDGKPAMVQTTKTGKAIQTELPTGFQISKDPIRVDLGTHIQLIDPQTRQPIGNPIQKDLAGAEREKVLGEETGKGMVALPQVLSTANQTLQSIEQVRNHPGRSWGTGALGTVPGIPGTSQRGFVAALDQLKGKTFLEAFNALRGGGAITEAEGAKATNAMARLDRAQNKEDFEAGLNDLRDVVKAGMLRAAAKARTAGGSLPQAASPVSGPTGPTTQVPPAAIEALRANPALKADFEAKYGAGMAGIVLR